MAGKIKRAIKGHNMRNAAIFLCLVGIAFFLCVKTFTFDDAEKSYTMIDQFYATQENTIDCVYFGSSAVQRGYVTPVAFHDHGVASYSFSSGTQPFMMTKYLMKEVLRTQHPKLFVVELRGSCKGPDEILDIAVRRIVDNIDHSENWFNAIGAVTDYASHGTNNIDLSGASYYFSFLKYHSLWNPSKHPHHFGMDYYKGYALDPQVDEEFQGTFSAKEIIPFEPTDEKLAVAPATEEALRDLLDYCDTIDTKVLFVISPYRATEEGMKRLNYNSEIIRERGYEVLDLLPDEKMKEMGIRYDTCFYNEAHLNYYGSLRFTDYIAKYMADNYDLPDRRGEAAYDSWEDEYKRLMYNVDEGIYKEKYDNMMSDIEAKK